MKYSRKYGYIIGWYGLRMWGFTSTFAGSWAILPQISLLWRDMDGPYKGLTIGWGKWHACIRTINEDTYQEKLHLMEKRNGKS